MSNVPRLLPIQNRREVWRENSPRLTEEQKQKLQGITREVYAKIPKQNITRKTFAEIHQSLEDELADKIRSQLGLMAGLEWRGIFPQHVSAAFQQAGTPNKGYAEGILPTNDFLQSHIFDYIEVFQPRVVVFQFDDYNGFMDSAEQSIKQAEDRRGDGGAYFTERDRAINFQPGVTPSEVNLEEEDGEA